MKYKLDKKYQPIFNLARPYYKRGREKEGLHHLVVTWMMKNILKEADNLWMTTKKAFWLDSKKRMKIKPKKWFKILEQRFTKDNNYTKYLTTKFAKKRVKWFLKEMRKEVNSKE